MDKCVNCGEASIVDDEENGHNVRVCTECGTVQGNNQEFVSSHDFVGTTISNGLSKGPSTKRRWMQTNDKTEPASLKDGEKIIGDLGSMLHFREHMIGEAVNLYRLAFYEHVYNHAREKKIAMCQACIYSVAKQKGIAIPIRNLTGNLEGSHSLSLFNQCLTILKSKHNVHLPTADLLAEIECLLSHKDFPRQLQELTFEMMKLLEHVWITEGRRRAPFIIVAAFIAWKSSNFLDLKKKNLTEFCKKYQLKMPKGQRQRYDQVYGALLSLVNELPWIEATGTDVVEPYLKDVVKYKKSLLQEAIDTYLSKTEAEPDDVVTKKNEMKVVQEHGNLFRKFASHKRVSEASNDTDSRKKVRISGDSDDESDLELVLGSDDDTDLYIKSKQEVELAEHMRSKCVE